MLRAPMSKLVLVCLGGAIGSGARYLVGTWIAAKWGTGFPWGTLAINVTGSFLISVVMFLGLEVGMIGPELRLLLAVGVLGGFTTYSTFNYETTNYLREGAWLFAAVNATATVAGCLIAGFAGLAVERFIVGR
jgi:CrcB protein